MLAADGVRRMMVGEQQRPLEILLLYPPQRGA
jgi:hypothetical protein